MMAFASAAVQAAKLADEATRRVWLIEQQI
jgi:hypothetical protein